MELDVGKYKEPGYLSQFSANEVATARSQMLTNWLDKILARKQSLSRYGLGNESGLDYVIPKRINAKTYRLLPDLKCEVIHRGRQSIVRCPLGQEERVVRRIIAALDRELADRGLH